MVTLKDRFRGCIAATWTGSAMGAAVEGWSPEKIKETHGRLATMLPYKHYTWVTDWDRVPGTTEDGIERQKLVATAIIEKRDRVDAHDVSRVWLRDLDPAKVIYKQEGFDLSLLELLRAKVPACELGRFWPYPNVISVARATHPLGLINAGDPEGAARDTFEVGKLYFPETAVGLRWGALYNAAVAEACRPQATVASVVETALRFARFRVDAKSLHGGDEVGREMERALEIVEKNGPDEERVRAKFYEIYFGGKYFNYAYSQANEIVSKGLAIFVLTKGNPKEAILAAVNFGRDTDCLAAVAGGLAGTLSGTGSIPAEWIATVEAATKKDPYTNNRRTIEETAGGLFAAWTDRRKRLETYVRSMGDPAFLAG